ncbi:uncharacterized protein [Fopius arisanus]|uniref:BTBD8_0 protein n=1 Tax=Fopius arisanus TaxID=64838 RepID=A0A0C9PRF7_9HYME|nr:PREDICTED: uncharacterized protein LOC105268779 [Fopius arisanus]XP_011306916.1 PREDICTED: uncharacterized protein LOC105268779 [Fopius arisanus]XP_011306925.1 PREDICTED: uncharacterized protein LOC105268779 [Fopius arisanus]XP_011306930.1 PREDICTED: uncharacterized protein LOC105268779 [Fopius arisanus]
MRLMAGSIGTGKRGNFHSGDRKCRRNTGHLDFLSEAGSQTFEKRKIVENRRTYIHNISTLQKSIFRIFLECLHCDLYIIHESHVIQTNTCIVKARAPKLYDVLEDYFVNEGRPSKCVLRSVEIFQQVQDFVRLIYCNLDITTDELYLVHILKNDFTSLSLSGNDVNLTPSASEMADSGLETGSFSLQETTESENSGTDLEESHYISTDDDFIRVSITGDIVESSNNQKRQNDKFSPKISTPMNLTSPSGASRQDPSSSGSSSREEKHMTPSKYENQVLNNPAYDSDTNDNNQGASFISTASFEFHIAESSPKEKPLKPEGRNVIVENPSFKKSSSSINSYYFIDASSLNDEPDVSSLSILSEEKSSTSLPPYLESSYIPSRTHPEDQKPKKSSLQIGHENMAQFQRELILTEYLEPITEPRKIKRVDSATEEKPEPMVEKESLVVEIKEADSGESNHPSPCIDNNKKARENESSQGEINRLTNEIFEGPVSNTTSLSDSRRSSLIRGNTFELESGDEKLSHLRQEYERRQGNLVFKNSIPQYSGHRVDDDLISSSNYSIMNYSESSKSKNLGGDDNGGVGGGMGMKSASDKNLAECSETDDSSIGDCTSLPATFETHMMRASRSATPKRPRRDETTPIVSGGVSSVDYSTPVDSPIVRRKTESTPIVSGGAVLMNSHLMEKVTKPKMSSSMTTWIVDMSDCGKKPNYSLGNMSQSFSSSDCISKSPNNRSKGSLGFFVNLKDVDPPKDDKSGCSRREEATQFFVDLSKVSDKSNKVETNGRMRENLDKKNIFSMFIDLNDSDTGKIQGKSKPAQPRSSDDSGKEGGSESSQESRSAEKKSVFMYIESDSPVVRRRTLSTSKPTLQRHSWNVEKVLGNGLKEPFRKEHKRARSVSIDPDIHKKMISKNSGSICSLNQEKSPQSAQSAQSAAAPSQDSLPKSEAPTEILDYEIRDTPPNSHVEIINEDISRCAKRHELKDLMKSDMGSSTEASVDPKATEVSDDSVWEKTGTESTEGHTRKSETFDISSGSASGPSSSDHQEFEISEYRMEKLEDIPSKISETHKSLTKTIKKIEDELDDDYDDDDNNEDDEDEDVDVNTPSQKAISDIKEASSSGFVRLSDLDKTPAKVDVTTEDTTRITNLSYRMSKSIPETSWVESKLALNRSSGPCPVRTLLNTRKFTSIMSTSLPAKHKSPIDELQNDVDPEMISESEISSMQSSMGRSGADVSTEETETSSFANVKPYNRLGEDLLRMFLEEINPDVTIDVSGRRIRAHKCILSSRCQYFAAILSGGWIESAGNVISLQGYSYSSVHFALCHIYSGESNIPDSISIVELATLADMLCLEGLKEVIGYTLKVKYCHLFHKPCQLCAVGVLECLPLAAAYGLDEVYRKSLRWITRHFVRIWPCKAFATLPRELMDKCYHQHIVHMSADNVLQTIMECDKLLATLPNIRWAEPVFRMVSNLLETALKFLSDNFSSVLNNDSFQALGRDLTWNISRLEDNVLAAADRLPPDQACRSYSKLFKMLGTVGCDEHKQWNPLFVEFLKKIQARVEKCLVKEAPRAARTTTWLKMDLELRRRIQELACLVILPHEALKRPIRHSREIIKESKTLNKSSVNRGMELRKIKMNISDETVSASKAGVNQKRVMVKPKTDPLERKMQDSSKTVQASGMRPKSWPNKLEVKSRYLEPRTKSVPKDTSHGLPERITAVQQRRKIMISSSDSSRTSSPAMKRAVDKKPPTKIKLTVKKEMTVKALSTDSLTESCNERAVKKDNSVSKSCGITRPESPSTRAKDVPADSLSDIKKKRPAVVKKTPGKMDTSMSTDSLMGEISGKAVSNKVSPTLGRAQVKKSPPMAQKSPLTVARRPVRSVESSTAASRNRAAATSIYQGSPNLRRNLLDAAKTPDIGRTVNGVSRITSRQSTPSTSTPPVGKREKRDSNTASSESPSKRSPKMNGVNRPPRVAVKRVVEKGKGKPSETTKQQLTVGSRSGTFLKDEPTILKKSDMKTTQVMS